MVKGGVEVGILTAQLQFGVVCRLSEVDGTKPTPDTVVHDLQQQAMINRQAGVALVVQTTRFRVFKEEL